MGMRHGLHRASCSRNPKSTSTPLIFLRKMAAFRCFARHKVMLACASAARMPICHLSHRMAVGESRKFNPARGLQKPENMLQ